jgi:PAS domain S-box-containing protein
MQHNHGGLFVLLSVLIAILGSWTALDLFKRVRSHIGSSRRLWLAAAAVAMGFSIWSMHFVAMLGFDPGSPVSYDPALTALSLALAVGATLGAFFAASRELASVVRLTIAGLAMGAGICLMHYVGMAALRTAVSLGYRPGFVAASFAIAVAASTAALFAARRERSSVWQGAASVILGLAIVGMHYTAMAGLMLSPAAGAAQVAGAPPMVLGPAVAAGAMVILFLALTASLYDQRLNVLSALEAGGVGYWELMAPTRTLHMSARGKEIFGRPPDEPVRHAELLAQLTPEDRARRDKLLQAALETGVEYDAEYRIEVAPGDQRWVNVRGRVVASSRGRARRMAGVVIDVTERRLAFEAVEEAERRQRLLIDELNHRVKNTLATVQSIARQSAKSASSVEAFRRAFEARLKALSHAHDALTRGAWEAASLNELLVQEFSPYSPDQVRLEGEDVKLKPRHTVAFGMIFHELTTNAAKYGALSQGAGSVSVRWRQDEARRLLELDWIEADGPLAAAPARAGFGSRLVQALVEGDLGGTLAAEHPETGFRYRISARLD